MKNGGQIPWNGITCLRNIQDRLSDWKSRYERRFGLCKKAASMIIGISMDQEIFLILGQVSLSLLYQVRNLQKDICGPEGDQRENS